MSSFPDHQIQHDPVADRRLRPSSWHQIVKRVLDHAPWPRRTPRATQNQPEPTAAVKTSSTSRAPKIILGLAVALLLLIAIPIILIIRAESRPTHVYRQGKSVVARGESLLGMTQQGTAKPKPSPYKYTLATPITKPSTPIVVTPPRLPNSSAAVTPQSPAQMQSVQPALPQTATNTMPPPSPATCITRWPKRTRSTKIANRICRMRPMTTVRQRMARRLVEKA